MKKRAFLFVFTAAAAGLIFSFAVFAHEGHRAEHNHPYPKGKFSVKNGQKLYNQYCATCHGLNGDGKGPAASALNPRPTNFLDLKYMPMKSRLDHYEAIANGRPGSTMPPFKNTLASQDMWHIVAYIEHLFNHQWNSDSHNDKNSEKDMRTN